MVDMVRVPTTEDFSVDEWSFDIDANAIIAQAVNEALRTTFAEPEFRPRANLPYEWSGTSAGIPGGDGMGGAPVQDPLAIDFNLPAFSNSDDVGPGFRVSLEELLDSTLDLLGDQLTPDNEGYAIICAMRDRLRQLADKLDASLQH